MTASPPRSDGINNVDNVDNVDDVNDADDLQHLDLRAERLLLAPVDVDGIRSRLVPTIARASFRRGIAVGLVSSALFAGGVVAMQGAPAEVASTATPPVDTSAMRQTFYVPTRGACPTPPLPVSTTRALTTTPTGRTAPPPSTPVATPMGDDSDHQSRLRPWLAAATDIERALAVHAWGYAAAAATRLAWQSPTPELAAAAAALHDRAVAGLAEQPGNTVDGASPTVSP